MNRHVLGLLALGSMTGCFWVTTRYEGDALRRDVESLTERTSTKARVLDDQVVQLRLVVDEATKILKRNNADIGADVDELRSNVRDLNGLAASMSNSIAQLHATVDRFRTDNDSRLAGLEQRVAQLESGAPSPNSSPDDLWRLGSEAFAAGHYPDAIEIFGRLASTFPTHPRAADALYFKGQAYSDLHDWGHAIDSFQALVRKFPQSSVADDGLYYAAEAAQSLKSCAEARTYLGLIKLNYPRSNVRDAAVRLDRALHRELRDRTKCTS